MFLIYIAIGLTIYTFHAAFFLLLFLIFFYFLSSFIFLSKKVHKLHCKKNSSNIYKSHSEDSKKNTSSRLISSPSTVYDIFSDDAIFDELSPLSVMQGDNLLILLLKMITEHLNRSFMIFSYIFEISLCSLKKLKSSLLTNHVKI
jgi:hypothetical protein